MADRPDFLSELEARGGPEHVPETGGEDGKDGGEEMIPKSRFDEVLQRSKSLEQSQDQFILAALRGGQAGQPAQQGHGEQATGGPDLSALEGLDPEVATGIIKVIEQSNQEFASNFMQEFRETYGTALDFATRQEQVREVEETVEGFSEVEEKVAARYRALSPDRQREHDSRVGIAALTAQVRLDEALETIEAIKGQGSVQAGRAAITPANRGATGPEARGDSDIDPWKGSDEDFDKFQREQGLL